MPRKVKVTIRRKGKIIGVVACKGGVGKTTVAVNLASFLMEKYGDKVILVETNLTAPNVGMHLGVIDPPVTIHDVLSGEATLARAIYTTGYGLKFIPGFIGVKEEVHFIDFRPLLEPLRKEYLFIILDTAPGLGAETIASIKASNELLVVTNPDIPTIATTLRTFRAAQRYRVPIAGVVVNKIMKKKYEVPLSEIKRTLTYPVVGAIPFDEKVMESLAAGVPVINYARCPASRKFREMGKNLLKRWK
jgi:septum site-determining protein MinD